MGIRLLDRIRDWFARSDDWAGADDKYYSGNLYQVIRRAAAGINVTPALAMQCSAFYACAKGLAEDMSSLPLILYKRTDDGRERATEHPLYGVLHDEPNPEMSSMQLREMWELHQAQYGDAFNFIDRTNGGMIKYLWPLHPQFMTVERDRATRLIVYKYRPSDDDPKDYRPGQILHLRGLSDDGIIGRSIVSDAADAIALAIACEQYSSTFFGNNALLGGVFEMPTTPGDNERKAFKEELDRQHIGLKRMNRPIVLYGGLQYKQTTATPEQAMIVDLLKFAVIQIIRFFRVHPSIIQDHDRSTFSNVASQVESHVKFTLRPRAVRNEQEISRKLLTPAERKTYYAEHLFEGMLRADLKTRTESYVQELQNGIKSINEVRREMNLLPVEGGDAHQTQVNLQDMSATEPAEEEDG